MSIDTIYIGNANTYQLTDFRDAISGALESDVTAFASLCVRTAPSGGSWLVENASTSSPIVITSTNHGLVTGQKITIVNVGDQRGAHGTFVVTVVDANNFSLNGSTSIAAYSQGGQFFACIQDCAGLAFSLVDTGQYQVEIDGNVGLVNNTTYVMVIYCTGTYRDLYNEIDRVTARTRGNN
ncbi:MAG: hypothetical protein WCH39_26370 [Schlesneria sp.]